MPSVVGKLLCVHATQPNKSLLNVASKGNSGLKTNERGGKSILVRMEVLWFAWLAGEPCVQISAGCLALALALTITIAPYRRQCLLLSIKILTLLLTLVYHLCSLAVSPF